MNGASVCTAPSNQFSPMILADGAGGAILAWFDHRSGTTPDIYAHRILSSGTRDPSWPTEGRAICTAIRGQYAPVLSSDGLGGAIVAWHDFRGGNTCDVYAQHVLASGAVDPVWPVDGRALTTASDDQTNPGIVSDGAGGAIVVWTDYSGGPESDIRAQHVLSTGAVDPAWPVNGRVLCAAGGNQSVPCIASDGAGGAIVAWSDLRGANADIYAQRVLASGALAPGWPVDGFALCTASGNQSGPSIVADDGGGFLVSWHDYRSALDADIFAHRLLPSGTADPVWPAGGRNLCAAVGEQYSTGIVRDGSGGAIVVWYDYRAGEVEGDIYAHHVRATGLVDASWPADGRALCAEAGDQVTPTIVADGSGGAFATWHDYRDVAQSDVYAHRVLASGNLDPAWPISGQALCLAPGDQYTPTIDTDGSGGVLTTWTDFRLGLTADIYAQRIFANGGVANVPPGPPIFHRNPRPNPARGAVAFAFELPGERTVTVDVLDLAGRKVRALIEGRTFPAGLHQVQWDGSDDFGTPQTNGIYFVRLTVPGSSHVWRVAMAR